MSFPILARWHSRCQTFIVFTQMSYSTGVDLTAGPWPVNCTLGQFNISGASPFGQLKIFLIISIWSRIWQKYFYFVVQDTNVHVIYLINIFMCHWFHLSLFNSCERIFNDIELANTCSPALFSWNIKRLCKTKYDWSVRVKRPIGCRVLPLIRQTLQNGYAVLTITSMERFLTNYTPPPAKQRKSNDDKRLTQQRVRKFLPKWEKQFPWIQHDDVKGMTCSRLLLIDSTVYEKSGTFVTGCKNYKKRDDHDAWGSRCSSLWPLAIYPHVELQYNSTKNKDR